MRLSEHFCRPKNLNSGLLIFFLFCDVHFHAFPSVLNFLSSISSLKTSSLFFFLDAYFEGWSVDDEGPFRFSFLLFFSGIF